MDPTTTPPLSNASEPVSPSQELFIKSFFDSKEYTCFKAIQFYTQKENGGHPEAEIRADMPYYASQIAACFAKAHVDPWQHYRRFGAFELVNPSNDFDATRYLEAKAKAMNEAGIKHEDGEWDVPRVLRALARAKLSPLEHCLRFAGKGRGEVREGITSAGTIPPAFAVPEEKRVPKLADADIVTPVPAKKDPEPVEKRRNPKDYFSPGCYLQFKALHDFVRKEHGGLTVAQIRQNIFLYASEVLRIFEHAHIDPWTHYREYGTVEGINPSNDFDTVAYLQAKAQALNAAGLLNDGHPWDAEAVARSLKREHISALEHFLLYAGTGPGEVPHGLTPEGLIPEEFSVPDVVRVPEVSLARITSQEPPEAPPPATVSPKDPVLPGSPPATRETTQPELIPEYTFAVPFRPTDWKSLATGLKGELWEKSLARRLIALFVLIPGLCIFLYLLLFASKAYISETRFAVRGQNSAQSFEGFSSLFNLPTSTQSDSYIVLHYITSLDMVQALDAELFIKDHYANPNLDVWYRLAKNAKQDELLDYWGWACNASYDPDTSIVDVRIKAFSPEMALAICEGVLAKSEALVNAMNTRARKDALTQAEAEVRRAEERIRKAREAMREYRDTHVMLDPEAVASGLYGVVNRLEADVTKTAAELAEARTYMRRAPRVKQLENRLAVLQQKLLEEKRKLAGNLKDGQSVNEILSGFQALALEEEFAQKQLTSAMASLEAARVRADAQTQYVEAFERPMLADESLYPRPLLFSCIYMITALLLLGLCSLIVAAVREHAGF